MGTLLDWLRRYAVPLSLVLLALAILAGVYTYQRATAPPPLRIVPPTPRPTQETVIKVQVAGAAVRPGVYTLRSGSRVEDALKAAGGPTDDADVDRLNLAARVSDGQKLEIPRKGQEIAAYGTAGPEKINLNVATVSQLDELPGIGPVIARRIVEYRERNGPFSRVEQLRDAKLVNNSTYEKIKDMVTVD